eukprot:TRINITY_DN101195_c0_g1_i1.p1 TRINITY_DN101195_c0_g1~~TRINITY_DN101195_c0_g1_i1.p1  ORF type:complete len:576 (-),score=117.66 TRINITY_DN101195_c0_g1_i1:44-1771(-)
MRRLFLNGVLALVLQCLLGSCARLGESDYLSGTRSKRRKRHARRKKEHWTYDAPEYWVDEFPNCGGSRQSPININIDASVFAPDSEKTVLYDHISYKHELHNRKVFNNGRALQVDGRWGRLRLPHGLYYMRHLSFHFPSEHTVDGRELVGEMQLVHEKHGTEGWKDVAIVSVLLERGDHKSKFMSTLGFGHGLPGHGKSHRVGTMSLAPIVELMKGDFIHYEGSLTSPPCTEGVKWYILSDTLTMSGDQIKDFHKIFPYPNNARPTQPLGDRVVAENALDVSSATAATGAGGSRGEAGVLLEGSTLLEQTGEQFHSRDTRSLDEDLDDDGDEDEDDDEDQEESEGDEDSDDDSAAESSDDYGEEAQPERTEHAFKAPAPPPSSLLQTGPSTPSTAAAQAVPMQIPQPGGGFFGAAMQGPFGNPQVLAALAALQRSSLVSPQVQLPSFLQSGIQLQAAAQAAPQALPRAPAGAASPGMPPAPSPLASGLAAFLQQSQGAAALGGGGGGVSSALLAALAGRLQAATGAAVLPPGAATAPGLAGVASGAVAATGMPPGLPAVDQSAGQQPAGKAAGPR